MVGCFGIINDEDVIYIPGVTHQISRKLLRMDELTSETC